MGMWLATECCVQRLCSGEASQFSSLHALLLFLGLFRGVRAVMIAYLFLSSLLFPGFCWLDLRETGHEKATWDWNGKDEKRILRRDCMSTGLIRA